LKIRGHLFLGASARLYSPLPRVSATGLVGLRRGVLQVLDLLADIGFFIRVTYTFRADNLLVEIGLSYW